MILEDIYPEPYRDRFIKIDGKKVRLQILFDKLDHKLKH